MVQTVRYGKSVSLSRVRVIGNKNSKPPNPQHSHSMSPHLGWHQRLDTWYSSSDHTSYNWNSHVRRNSVLCIACVHCFRVEWHNLLLLVRSVCLYRCVFSSETDGFCSDVWHAAWNVDAVTLPARILNHNGVEACCHVSHSTNSTWASVTDTLTLAQCTKTSS